MNSLPASIEAWNDPILQADPMIALFGEQLFDAKAPINKPEFQEISVSIDRRVEEAIYGKKSPVEAAKDLKMILKRFLNNNFVL